MLDCLLKRVAYVAFAAPSVAMQHFAMMVIRSMATKTGKGTLSCLNARRLQFCITMKRQRMLKTANLGRCCAQHRNWKTANALSARLLSLKQAEADAVLQMMKKRFDYVLMKKAK